MLKSGGANLLYAAVGGAARRFLARSGSRLIEEFTAAVARQVNRVSARMRPIYLKFGCLLSLIRLNGFGNFPRLHFYGAVQRDAENATSCAGGKTTPDDRASHGSESGRIGSASVATQCNERSSATHYDTFWSFCTTAEQLRAPRQRVQRFAQVWQLVKQQLSAVSRA